jgi:hypothetical protein
MISLSITLEDGTDQLFWNVSKKLPLRSRNNQHYAQICTTALFYILAPTCFGSSLPSSGNFWIHLSCMKIQIDLVVYHIMLVMWPVCWSVAPSVSLPAECICCETRKHNRLNHNTPAHRPLNQRYIIYHQIDLHFHVTQTDPEVPWWWQTTANTCRKEPVYRLKEWYKSVHSVGYFCYVW